jgi:intergrase/recombinase
MARYTNNQYIIVAMDYIMKWVEAKTFKNNITKNIANFLYEHIITRFGCLAHLVSD